MPTRISSMAKQPLKSAAKTVAGVVGIFAAFLFIVAGIPFIVGLLVGSESFFEHFYRAWFFSLIEATLAALAIRSGILLRDYYTEDGGKLQDMLGDGERQLEKMSFLSWGLPAGAMQGRVIVIVWLQLIAPTAMGLWLSTEWLEAVAALF